MALFNPDKMISMQGEHVTNDVVIVVSPLARVTGRLRLRAESVRRVRRVARVR